jgi:hypothetical protein
VLGEPLWRLWLSVLLQLSQRQQAALLIDAERRRARGHNDFLWAKILLLHAENLFIDFGAES